jgi:catechol 2,3-dioxygenase
VSGVRRFEHARLRTPDLEVAVAFYTEVMGLVALDRDEETVYLGAGADENFDLALIEGGTGIEHFALRVDRADDLDRLERAAHDAGLAPERGPGEGPGELERLGVRLVSGHRMEFVTVADHRYHEPYRPSRGQLGVMDLLDADHINLVSDAVRPLCEQFRDVFGLRVSDLIQTNDDAPDWMAAWMRAGSFHHDVAVLFDGDAGHSLHHFAWSCASIDHLKLCCDRLATAGVRLELGIGRHPVGANLYVYFWDPSGNRTELSAEMAFLGDSTPARVWSSPAETLDAWGERLVPDSFRRGS